MPRNASVLSRATALGASFPWVVGGPLGTVLFGTVLLGTFLLATLLAEEAAAQEWTRFRGPNGSGISDARSIPVTFTEKDYRWTADLPGKGISSPVIWNDKVFVTSADEDKGERYLLCHRTSDGEKLWSKSFPFEREKKHARNSYATATPAVDDERVYVIWTSRAKAELLAFTHDGQAVWSYDMGPYQSGHGGGTSPVVIGDLVVLNNHQERNSYLLAVDRRSGQQKWKVAREGGKASYSTPCARANAAGQTEVVFTSFNHGVTAVSANTGTIAWEKSGLFDNDEEDKRAIGSPFVSEGLVFASCGFTAGKKILVGLRPPGAEKAADKTDDKGTTTVEQVYRQERVVNHMPTAIAYQGLVFTWADNGVVTCSHVKDGSQAWQKRVGGNYSGSPIIVDGKLYAISDAGDVVVLAAADKFEQLGSSSLGQTSSSTPAVSGGVMYLRTYSKLFAIGGPR